MQQLVPRTGTLPSTAEIVRRLRAEFRRVIIDEDAGLERALATAVRIERICERDGERALLGHRDEALAQARRLRNLSRGEAAVVEFGDEGGELLEVLVAPEHYMGFSFRGDDDEAAAMPLIKRCAQILDCEVVLV